MAEEENNNGSNINTILNSKQEKAIPDWLMPILSGLGSMGGSYMLWVKPLQDNFKAMAEQIEDLKDDVEEIKQKQKEVDRNFSEKLQIALEGLQNETSKRFVDNKEDDNDEHEPTFQAKKGKHIRQTKTKKAVTILK
ncbi:hypothetical protein BH11BAC2_BH11BAC2_11240 [soil metagenome]